LNRPVHSSHKRSIMLLPVVVCLLGIITVGQAVAQSPPVIISETDSTRAIAFDSVTFVKEPFPLSSRFAADGRTRVMVFTLNVPVSPGVESLITADVETANHQHHSLIVESAFSVPSLPWLTALVVRLNDQLNGAGDVLLRITHCGVPSNRVRIAIDSIGGGPPDDSGAGPTPAPPYVIRGRIKVAGEGFSGVSVALTGDQNAVVTTDETGSYSFVISSFGNYTLTPTKPFFDFTPVNKVFTNLSGNQLQTDFAGVRRMHTVSGRVLNEVGQGVNGINITVLDENNSTLHTTTSGDGNFVFPPLTAGFNFTVSPLATNVLQFSSQTITSLSSNQQLTFAGVLREYTVNGSVTGTNNTKVSGVLLRLTGSRTGFTRTDANGNYSFIVKALDSFTVTPSIEQDFFAFTPAQQRFDQNTSNRTVNFSASAISFPNPPYVLEFDGSPKTVDYGNFFPAFTNLGHFFWEFWAMPGPNAGATYLLSDGYGGAHAILFGVANFNTSEPARYQLLGNLNDGIASGDHVFYFVSDQGPAVNEWGHLAAGWDGQNIITYFNGVPVGKTPYSRTRQSIGPGNGNGRLLIGGSDHSNFQGRIAQVRGYEGTNPRELQSVESSFTPQTIFTPEGNLLSYYFRAGPFVADLSQGFVSGTHFGWPRGTLAGILGDCGPCPPPQFVLDPGAPNFVTSTAAPPVAVAVAPVTPANALVFDSFSRANAIYTFGSLGGLGSTETGTAGQLTWQTPEATMDRKPFGILNGVGVLLGNNTSLTWVNPGPQTGRLDIRVNRKPGRWGSGTNTGLSFRVMDTSNYFFAYTTDSIPSPGNQFVTVGYYSGGSRNVLASVLAPADWTTLRVVTGSDGLIQVVADSTLLYSTTNLILASATGAGLFNNGPGLGLVNRWDNFTIFRIAP